MQLQNIATGLLVLLFVLVHATSYAEEVAATLENENSGQSDELHFDDFTITKPDGDGWEITERSSNHIFYRRQLSSPSHAIACEVYSRPKRSVAEKPEEYLKEISDQVTNEMGVKPPEGYDVTFEVALVPQFGPMSVMVSFDLVARQAVVPRKPAWAVFKRDQPRRHMIRMSALQFVPTTRPDLEFDIYAKHFGFEGEEFAGFAEFKQWCFASVRINQGSGR